MPPAEGQPELPLFVHWVDFLGWLLPATGKFPKSVRFTFSSRIDNLALDVLEDVIEARYSRGKAEILRRANMRLEKLRVLLRICHGQRYLATNGYEHAARRIDEAGRMLGGWLKQQGGRGVTGAGAQARPEGLFERVVSFGNLFDAARKAVRGKKRRPDVQRLLLDLEPALLRLSDELRAGAWLPGSYRLFTVHEPKTRDIAAVPLPDRIVHHAILNVLEPAFEARSIAQSYACRPGKGMHAAVARARDLATRHPYFFKGDVRRYFDSVDHSVLDAMLAELVPDDRLLELLRTILRHQPPGAPRGRGIPIGNLTSQHFANLYLGVLDRALGVDPGGSEDGRYLRYMDDVLLFGRTKDELHRAKATAAAVLRDPLKLELKEAASFVAPVSEGVPFLGVRVFPGTIRLGRGALARFRRGHRARLRGLGSGRLTEAAFLASAASAAGHVTHANTFRMRTSVFGEASTEGVRA